MAISGKRVRVSDDSGVTYFTLPGNNADLRNEAGEIVDTIFGQNWSSSESGLIGWTITGNGLYKGFAGYVADIKQQGVSTAMTTEACSLVSGKTYQIDDATKQIFDIDTPFTVFDNAVDQTANVESIDYLHGTVTFLAAYTPTTPITVTGSFFPTTNIGKANSFTLTQTAEALDNSDFATVQANNGMRTFEAGLRTVALELGGTYDLASGFFAALKARATVVVEINPDGAGNSLARGFFKINGQDQAGPVGQLETESVNFGLVVPDNQLLETPFAWVHNGASVLNTGLQKALTAWQTGAGMDVQYLEDGISGGEGGCIISEISLSGGLEVMNEFNITFTGNGELTAV